jgi:hypothetical protein
LNESNPAPDDDRAIQTAVPPRQCTAGTNGVGAEPSAAAVRVGWEGGFGFGFGFGGGAVAV